MDRRRTSFQFSLIRSILHGSSVAPLRGDFVSILDMGCGTRRWLLKERLPFLERRWSGWTMSHRFGQRKRWLIVRFAQADLFNGKPFADRTFDFTLQCLMAQAILAALWPGVFSELMRVTRPGSYIELFEGEDVILNAWPATQRFLACRSDTSRARGFDISLMECLGRLLLDVHLREIQVCTVQVPVGKWAGAWERCWKRISWQASRQSSPCCLPKRTCLPRSSMGP
jgi:SAM-dependent methyltransferase